MKRAEKREVKYNQRLLASQDFYNKFHFFNKYANEIFIREQGGVEYDIKNMIILNKLKQNNLNIIVSPHTKKIVSFEKDEEKAYELVDLEIKSILKKYFLENKINGYSTHNLAKNKKTKGSMFISNQGINRDSLKYKAERSQSIGFKGLNSPSKIRSNKLFAGNGINNNRNGIMLSDVEGFDDKKTKDPINSNKRNSKYIGLPYKSPTNNITTTENLLKFDNNYNLDSKYKNDIEINEDIDELKSRYNRYRNGSITYINLDKSPKKQNDYTLMYNNFDNEESSRAFSNEHGEKKDSRLNSLTKINRNTILKPRFVENKLNAQIKKKLSENHVSNRDFLKNSTGRGIFNYFNTKKVKIMKGLNKSSLNIANEMVSSTNVQRRNKKNKSISFNNNSNDKNSTILYNKKINSRVVDAKKVQDKYSFSNLKHLRNSNSLNLNLMCISSGSTSSKFKNSTNSLNNYDNKIDSEEEESENDIFNFNKIHLNEDKKNIYLDNHSNSIIKDNSNDNSNEISNSNSNNQVFQASASKNIITKKQLVFGKKQGKNKKKSFFVGKSTDLKQTLKNFGIGDKINIVNRNKKNKANNTNSSKENFSNFQNKNKNNNMNSNVNAMKQNNSFNLNLISNNKILIKEDNSKNKNQISTKELNRNFLNSINIKHLSNSSLKFNTLLNKNKSNNKHCISNFNNKSNNINSNNISNDDASYNDVSRSFSVKDFLNKFAQRNTNIDKSLIHNVKNDQSKNAKSIMDNMDTTNKNSTTYISNNIKNEDDNQIIITTAKMDLREQNVIKKEVNSENKLYPSYQYSKANVSHNKAESIFSFNDNNNNENDHINYDIPVLHKSSSKLTQAMYGISNYFKHIPQKPDYSISNYDIKSKNSSNNNNKSNNKLISIGNSSKKMVLVKVNTNNNTSAYNSYRNSQRSIFNSSKISNREKKLDSIKLKANNPKINSNMSYENPLKSLSKLPKTSINSLNSSLNMHKPKNKTKSFNYNYNSHLTKFNIKLDPDLKKKLNLESNVINIEDKIVPNNMNLNNNSIKEETIYKDSNYSTILSNHSIKLKNTNTNIRNSVSKESPIKEELKSLQSQIENQHIPTVNTVITNTSESKRKSNKVKDNISKILIKDGLIKKASNLNIKKTTKLNFDNIKSKINSNLKGTTTNSSNLDNNIKSSLTNFKNNKNNKNEDDSDYCITESNTSSITNLSHFKKHMKNNSNFASYKLASNLASISISRLNQASNFNSNINKLKKNFDLNKNAIHKATQSINYDIKKLDLMDKIYKKEIEKERINIEKQKEKIYNLSDIVMKEDLKHAPKKMFDIVTRQRELRLGKPNELACMQRVCNSLQKPIKERKIGDDYIRSVMTQENGDEDKKIANNYDKYNKDEKYGKSTFGNFKENTLNFKWIQDINNFYYDYKKDIVPSKDGNLMVLKIPESFTFKAKLEQPVKKLMNQIKDNSLNIEFKNHVDKLEKLSVKQRKNLKDVAYLERLFFPVYIEKNRFVSKETQKNNKLGKSSSNGIYNKNSLSKSMYNTKPKNNNLNNRYELINNNLNQITKDNEIINRNKLENIDNDSDKDNSFSSNISKSKDESNRINDKYISPSILKNKDQQREKVINNTNVETNSFYITNNTNSNSESLNYTSNINSNEKSKNSINRISNRTNNNSYNFNNTTKSKFLMFKESEITTQDVKIKDSENTKSYIEFYRASRYKNQYKDSIPKLNPISLQSFKNSSKNSINNDFFAKKEATNSFHKTKFNNYSNKENEHILKLSKELNKVFCSSLEFIKDENKIINFDLLKIKTNHNYLDSSYPFQYKTFYKLRDDLLTKKNVKKLKKMGIEIAHGLD